MESRKVDSTAVDHQTNPQAAPGRRTNGDGVDGQAEESNVDDLVNYQPIPPRRVMRISGGGLGVRLGEVWGSELVLGSRLDPCHDLLEFIGQSGTGSHWPSRDRWRPQNGCEVVGTFPQ